MPTSTDDYLTSAEAAALLGVSTRTVERWRLAGELVAVTIGRGARPRVYYHRPAVLAYLRLINEPVTANRDAS